MERFACPSADRMGRYHCIDDHVLCDGFVDCPNGEDEDRHDCMFYKTVSTIMIIFTLHSKYIGEDSNYLFLILVIKKKKNLIKIHNVTSFP